MFYVLQNESTAARRRVPILLTDAATGTTAQTGVATTTIFPYVAINGNAFIGGTGSLGEAGFGQYYYEFEANEVATLGLAGIHITAAGCRDYDAIAQIAAFDLYSASAGGGISAADVWNYVLTNSGQTADFQLDAAVQNAANAETQANLAATQTSNIAFSVWGEDIGAGPLSPFAAGTAGTILYTLGQGGTALTAGDVWDYASRTITGGIADTVQLVATPVDITTSSMSGIANTVWSTDVSGYTSPSAGFDLTQAASGGSGITAGDVWDFSITGFGDTNSSAYYLTNTLFTSGNIETYVQNQTPQDIWSYAGIEGRTITGGLADTVTTLTNRSGFAITGGTVDTVTNDVNVSTASMAGIANTVWSTLTAPYTTHATFGHQILRSDNAATIGEVTLHQSGGSKRVDADVHAFINNTASATAMLNILTGIGASMTTNITGNLSGSVGSVTNPVDVSTSSMSGIANTVWATDVSGYTSPSAGYSLYNATGGVAVTAGDIWSYATRTITGGIADTVTTVSGNVLGSVNSVVTDVTISTGTQASIANSVWSFDISTGPASPSASYYVNNINTEAQSAATDASTAASNTNDIGGTVWGYDPTALTSPQAGAILTDIGTDTNSIITDIGNVPNNVWASDVSGYSTPGEAGFELTQAAAGAGLTAGDVWSYATRTITGGIADTVTTLTDRAGFAITGGTVDTVTNPVTFDSVQYAGIASSVWNAATRTLTSSGSGISAFDVWNFVLSDANTAEVDLVQAAAGSGLTAGDVWSAPSRTITGGIADTVTTLTNRSGFAITGGTVDNVTNGVTVSTNNDKTGYSLSGTQSFNLTGNITGNLSGSVGSVTSGVTVTTNNDKTGYALSGAGVSAVQSGLSTLTQAQVGTEVDSSLSDVGLTTTVTGRIDATVSSRLASASYTAPPTEAAIWSYTPRTLTSGAGASAYEVWNFATRSLTSGAGITVNAATNIINGPYFVKSNVDSQDGNLDVIRGMVQDIQLTVTDAFQNPFDVTALGLAVNFYDQAGTLVTSYGTSNLYAPAGLVQFTLDTAVTANEGRYNLILSAAGSGNTIKFGPLQTLVRPF